MIANTSMSKCSANPQLSILVRAVVVPPKPKPGTMNNNLVLFIGVVFFFKFFLNMKIRNIILLTFLLSLTIELAQLTGLFFTYPGSYRLFDVDDLMANTLGGFLGTVLSNKVIIHNQLMMAPRNSKYIIFNLSTNLGDYFRTHKLSISLMDCFLYM